MRQEPLGALLHQGKPFFLSQRKHSSAEDPRCQTESSSPLTSRHWGKGKGCCSPGSPSSALDFILLLNTQIRYSQVHRTQQERARMAQPCTLPFHVQRAHGRGSKGYYLPIAACRWATNLSVISCFFWMPAPCLGCQHTLASWGGARSSPDTPSLEKKPTKQLLCLPGQAQQSKGNFCSLPEVPQPLWPERGMDRFRKGGTSGNLLYSLIHLGRVQLSQVIPFPLFSTHPQICSPESCK